MENTKKKYLLYLQADCWKQTRKHALTLAGFVCEVCTTAKATQVHHQNYECIGMEQSDDLLAVCDACHRTIHGLLPLPRPANDNEQIEFPFFDLVQSKKTTIS